ncbi:hypothetical protein [Nitrincola schmidtii]|uniref:hypothetical protein n=1 Tax=Nitrincola schmidtii TaxID=1730894 RepID=UPI00124E0CDD|nr:hypothetical protein [Nitrincola schmidtii]
MLSMYERTRQNELFVIEVRLNADKQTRVRLDAFQNELIDEFGEPPEWFNLDFYVMASAHELYKAKTPDNEITTRIISAYKVMLPLINSYRPTMHQHKSLLTSIRSQPNSAKEDDLFW